MIHGLLLLGFKIILFLSHISRGLGKSIWYGDVDTGLKKYTVRQIYIRVQQKYSSEFRVHIFVIVLKLKVCTNEKNEILSAHLYNGFAMGMQYIQKVFTLYRMFNLVYNKIRKKKKPRYIPRYLRTQCCLPDM